MALRELLAKFGFEVDTAPLEKGGKSVNHFAESIEGIGKKLGAAALVGGLYEFTQGLVETGSELDDQSNRLGISSDELQAWRFAAGQGGASAEELGSGLKILTKNLAEAAGGGGPAKDFAALGINLKDADGKARSATDAIGDIADKIGKAESETEKAGIALKFFGKGGLALLPMLKEGREGVEKLQARFKELGGGMSQEFVKAADEAGDAQVELGVATSSLKDKLGIHLLPAVTWVVHKLTDFMIGVRRATADTNIMKVGLGVLGAAALVAAMEFAPLLLEVLSIAIPLALLALAIEDIYTAFTGGHSAIGEFIDGMFGVGATSTVIDYLKQAWDNVVAAVKAVLPALEVLSSATVAFLKDMFSGFKGYGDMFTEFFHFLWEDIKRGFDSVVEWIESKVPGLKIVLGGLSDGYKAIFGNTEDQDNPALAAKRAAALAAAGQPVGGQVAAPLPAGAGPAVQQTNQVDITVNGAGDPTAVGKKTAAAAAGAQTNFMLDAFGAVARP